MRAAILFILTGDPDIERIETDLDGYPAVDAETVTYLDGKELTHGTLAGGIETEVQVPVMGESTIMTEREQQTEQVVADYYVALDEAWGGITTSDATQPFEDLLVRRAGVMPEDATVLELDAWARYLADQEDANVWGLSHAHEDDDENVEVAGAAFHDAAGLGRVPDEGVSMLGFSYKWHGQYVRGAVAKSGYVAVYSGLDLPDAFAKWVSEEIRPFLRLGDAERDPQTVLSEVGVESSGEDAESESDASDDDPYANLDSVNVTGDGDGS